jgi:imidazolonepropionase-like amidohydrolase
MKPIAAVACAGLLGSLAWGAPVLAQDLVITNAHILDGKGGEIAKGSVVIAGGKIVSVAAGDAPASKAKRIDARGMTVTPGFIDAHRHPVTGDPKTWLAQTAPAEMKDFLENGFTTVYSMGDDRDAILGARKAINDGTMLGPRLFAAKMLPLARTAPPPPGAPTGDPARFGRWKPPMRPTQPAAGIPEAESRAAVDKAKAEGFDAIKTVLLATPNGPELATLKVIVDQAHKDGMRVYTHATTVEDTLVAISAGVDVLAHTPHTGRLEDDPETVKKIASYGAPMDSTLGVFSPHFDHDQQPIFRDNLPFPWQHVQHGGQGATNARLLWNAGVTYAFGTDTQWPMKESFAQELKPLSLVFSNADIITMLTKNAAIAANKQNELGTLEPGKLADIVMVQGDPLDDVWNLTKVALVVKGGEVVIDKR